MDSVQIKNDTPFVDINPINDLLQLQGCFF